MLRKTVAMVTTMLLMKVLAASAETTHHRINATVLLEHIVKTWLGERCELEHFLNWQPRSTYLKEVSIMRHV